MNKRHQKPRLRWSVGKSWVVYGLVLALIVGFAAFTLNTLTTPVYREGVPSTTTLPWTPPVPITPTAQSESATPSPDATPTATGEASPSPSKEVDSNAPFTLSDIRVEAVSASGTQRRYIIEVERGVELEANNSALEIAKVLNDPRSWAGSGDVRFSLMNDQSKAHFTISLVTDATATASCGKSPVCFKAKKVVISAKAWTTAPATFSEITDYQEYLVNHGVGLALAKKAKSCSGKGKNAPIMQQQWGDLKGCKANPWVF